MNNYLTANHILRLSRQANIFLAWKHKAEQAYIFQINRELSKILQSNPWLSKILYENDEKNAIS